MRYNREDIRDRLIERVFSPTLQTEYYHIPSSDSSRRFRKDASEWMMSEPTINKPYTQPTQPKIIKRASSLVNMRQLAANNRPVQYAPIEPVAIWRPNTAFRVQNKPQLVRSISNTSLADLIRKQPNANQKIVRVPSWNQIIQPKSVAPVYAVHKQQTTASTIASDNRLGKTIMGWKTDKTQNKMSMKGVTLKRMDKMVPAGHNNRVNVAPADEYLYGGFLNSIMNNACGFERYGFEYPYYIRSKAKMMRTSQHFRRY